MPAMNALARFMFYGSDDLPAFLHHAKEKSVSSGRIRNQFNKTSLINRHSSIEGNFKMWI